MKMGGKIRGLWIAFAVIGALGVAVAQEAPPVTQPAEEPAALTPAEMVVQAKGFLPQMDRSATAVRRQLSLAREQKDVVKALCLNDKLNQIDVALRSAKERMAPLRSAVGRKDADRARHEFTVIQVLRDRIRALVAEANQCIGEETGFVGDSRVTVDIDPSIPQTDPSEFPEDPLVSDPPVLSSPTL